MGQRIAVTRIAITQIVTRQHLGLGLAAIDSAKGRIQIAVLATQLKTTLGHQPRPEGGIHVRGDIPVIGGRSDKPAVTVGAETRRQEARLALVVEREGEPWRIQDGHILEIDRGILAFTDLAIVVELELAGPGVPVVVTRHTGGVGGIAQADLILAFEVDAVSVAVRFGRRFLPLERINLGLPRLDVDDARRRKAGTEPILAGPLRRLAARKGLGCRAFAAGCRLTFQGVGRLFEETHLILELHAHAWTGHHILALLQTHVPLRLDLIVDRPVGQLIRVEYRADLAQLGIPFGGEFTIDFPAHAIGAEKDRPRCLAVLGWRRHSLRRAQSQRRCRIRDVDFITLPGGCDHRRHVRDMPD